MAEINFNNLYNQLSPMDKMFYDQQFQKSYNPNKENLRLSGQENYDQMKAVYDAQQQVPEESFLDKINIFGSASAAEMPQVPNLTYRNIDLPFNLNTGVTNTTQAAPFLKSMADIDASGNVNTDLVNQLIMENQMKASQFDPTNFRSIFPSNVAPMPQEQTGITSTDQAQNFEFLKSAYEDQDEDAAQFSPGQELEQYETDKFGYRKEKNILQKLAEFIPFAGEKSLGRAIIDLLPKSSPEAQNIKNFYGSQFGLTPTGQVASGIMKGYNPVSGSNLLNKITGGFVPAKKIGLSSAIQKRISNILGRKIAQTAASKAKIKKLKELRDREIRDRADFGESLSSIGKSTFTGKGQAFAPKTNTFSGGKTKTTGGVPGGKYGSPK
jgi:hypothetical protein